MSKQSKPGTQLNQETLDKLGIEKVEEEIIYYAFATTPNDPIYPQWYTNTISAPDAWDDNTGSTSTIVAVIDSGYALAHEDLTDAWSINSGEQGTTQSDDICWTGSAEDKQTNGCDDDGNGYADDWRGWDFSNDDNFPQAGDNSVDGASHGTKVAGLIGARGNNGVGTASVNWNTQIMPLQALYDEGFGFSSDIAAAIVYAVDNGADVINMSLGGPTPDTVIRSAIQYANARNVIVVASSGNCGDQQTSPDCLGYASPGGMGYPARYPETIAVGATTSSDVRASFSSWGPELDIVAPGSGTIQSPTWLSTDETTAYSSSAFGTSFSTPIVAGYIASIKGDNPDYGRDDVLAVIAGGADKVAAMGTDNWTEEYGFGRLNMDIGLDTVADFEEDINKSSESRGEASSVAPQISTNIGHSASSAVTTTTSATTYCVTSPNTSCELIFVKQGTGTTVNLGAQTTNAQGITFWNWDRDDVGAAGTWDVTTKANSLSSSTEVLITQ